MERLTEMREGMRKILFRGKTLEKNGVINKGEWMHGSLLYNNNGDRTICKIIGSCLTNKGSSAMAIAYDVDPKTVCQYTGLTDKNGRKIFEGDILCNHYDENFPEEETMSVIVWDKFRWGIRESDVVDKFDDFDCKNGEVAGNIFDNPDLIGK